MESESKRIKFDENDVKTLNVVDVQVAVIAKPALSSRVRHRIQNGLKEGFDEELLDISNHESRGIDDSMVPELCEWLIKIDGKIKRLNLGWNNIKTQGASILFETLYKNNLSIPSISLFGNALDDDTTIALDQHIKQYSTQADLVGTEQNYANNETSNSGVHKNCKLKMLSLRDNKGITDKSIPLLLKLIENDAIENIDIRYTSITQQNALAVSTSIIVLKKKLNKLDLSYRSVNDDDMDMICEGISKYGCEKLREIDISGNLLTIKGIRRLFEVLDKENAEIILVNMNGMQMDDDSVIPLGEYINHRQTIELMWLSNNNLTDKGIEHLSTFLMANTKLKGIFLEGNKGVTDKSFSSLCDIAIRSCVTTLYLGRTSISDENLKEIKILIKKPFEEREIPIHSSAKSAAKTF